MLWKLVAEMSSAFLCASLGVEGKLQHENYIASWIKVLKEHKRAIFKEVIRDVGRRALLQKHNLVVFLK